MLRIVKIAHIATFFSFSQQLAVISKATGQYKDFKAILKFTIVVKFSEHINT